MEQKIKIMIVEDDELLAKELSSFLIKWGYAIILVKEFENILSEFLTCMKAKIFRKVKNLWH